MQTVDSESAERASVIQALLRQLARVGINPEKGFEAYWDGREWVFIAADETGASSSAGVHDNAPTIHASTTSTQKR